MKTKKEFRLPKEFVEDWITALRSGKYKQGQGELYSEGKYCCLGVACSISGTPDSELEENGLIRYKFQHTYCLPSEIIDEQPLARILSMMNDGLSSSCLIDDETKVMFEKYNLQIGKEYNFNEISDFIKKNVEFY